MKILQGVSRDVLERIKGKTSSLQSQSNTPVIKINTKELKQENEQAGYEVEVKTNEDGMKKSR